MFLSFLPQMWLLQHRSSMCNNAACGRHGGQAALGGPELQCQLHEALRSVTRTHSSPCMLTNRPTDSFRSPGKSCTRPNRHSPLKSLQRCQGLFPGFLLKPHSIFPGSLVWTKALGEQRTQLGGKFYIPSRRGKAQLPPCSTACGGWGGQRGSRWRK